MLRRFPRTILKMLGSELGRLVLVSASVLVSIVSFAAAVKPLSDGTLTPGQALTFMALASPPMLMYALPFAAGFAATLAYHRFGADNEANAAYAGGVSHRAVLLPALVVGVALLGLMLVLQHSVIPRFLRQMEQLVTRDVAQLLVNAVDRGDSLRIDDALIHADSATRLGADSVSGARERLLLEGVLAIGPGPEGGVSWEATAQRAVVWLFDADAPTLARAKGGAATPTPAPESGPPEQGSTVVVLQLINQSIVREGQGASRTSGDVYRFAVPGAFSDDPKFRDWKGLRDLRANPDPMASVDRRRRALAQALALDETVRAATLAIEGDGVLALRDEDGQWARLTAGGMRWDEQRGAYRLLPPAGESAVELLWRLDGGRARIQRAQRAWMRIQPPAGVAGAPVVALEMESVATREPGTEAAASAGETTRREVEHRDLRLAGSDADELFTESSSALLARAASRVGAGPTPEAGVEADIAAAARELRRNATSVRNEALALMHERVAMSIACLIMTLAGAVAALRLSDARPLLVYLRSFVPALLTVIAINSGENVTTENGPAGLALLWGGLAILGAFTVVEYLRLVRH